MKKLFNVEIKETISDIFEIEAENSKYNQSVKNL